MARALSNPEWAAFVSAVNVQALNLPPWGGVVEWSGMKILVFVGADGNIWASDITNDDVALAAIANLPPSYDQNQQVWYYQLPQQVAQQIVSVAQTAGQILNTATQAVGQTVGNLLSPTLSTLSGPLIIVVIALGLYFIPKRS